MDIYSKFDVIVSQIFLRSLKKKKKRKKMQEDLIHEDVLLFV